MEEGLLIGIDIADTVSQVCCFDSADRAPASIRFSDGRTVLDTPFCIADPEKAGDAPSAAVSQLAGHIAKLIEAAKKFTGITLVNQICITTPNFRTAVLDLIAAAIKQLGYDRTQWSVMSHEECYAYYAFNQKRELYFSGVMLLDFEADGVHAHLMQSVKQNGTALIREKRFLLDSPQARSVYAKTLPLNQFEAPLTDWLKKILSDYVVSSIYLTGKGFDTQEFPAGLTRFLCTRRKVFAGQNLFVKGACFGAYESVHGAGLDGVLLGCSNRITTGIEVDIVERAAPKRLRLVKPGTNWYMAGRSLDFILEDIRRIRLLMRPCDGSKEYWEDIDISEIPFRAGKMTRIRLELRFTADNRCRITICDRGFGEFVKSSAKTVCRDILLES